MAKAQSPAAAEEGEVAEAHSANSSSAGSAAEEHGLGISESSASEDMMEYDSDSDSDWRNDTDTSESDADAPTLQPPVPAYDPVHTEEEERGEGASIPDLCTPGPPGAPTLADEIVLMSRCGLPISRANREYLYVARKRAKAMRAAARIQAAARGRLQRNILSTKSISTHLPTPALPAPPSPIREACAAALQVSPDSVAAHPACPPTTAVEYSSAICLQAFTRMLLAQRAVLRMTTAATDSLRFFTMSAHEGYGSDTTAAAILLRFARHRCLPSQHRGDTIRTIKAKQLIKQLTTGLKGERERVSDQLAMAIQAEQAAQNEEETGVWEYTPCYLVKYVDGVETHLPTCAKTGCNMHRYSPPYPKHSHRGPGMQPLKESLFCSPECKDQVCESTGLRINELRWVHDDYHRRADDLPPSERAQHYRQVERAGGANPGL